jgi:hypothetical protein
MWFGLWLGILGARAAPGEVSDVHLGRVEDGIMEIALPGEVDDWKSLPWEAHSVDGSDVWRVTMKGLSHGDVRVGDTFTTRKVHDNRVGEDCKVVSFVTRSVAYNQWAPEEGLLPACGIPQVYAQLNCTGKKAGLYLAVRRGTQLTAYSIVPSEGTSKEGPAKRALMTPEIMVLVKAAHKQSWDKAAPIETEASVASLKGHPSLSLVDVHWYTGEGVEECAGDDFSDKRWALWDGSRILGPIQHNTARPVAIFTVGSDLYQVRPMSWDGWAITDLKGQSVHQLHDGFCGCPC